MSEARRIWLTRPEADSAATAAALTERRVESFIAPVMRIVSQPIEAPEQQPDALLLTSRHAVPALAALPQVWRAPPVYAVGEATASAAREAGFSNLITGDTDALALFEQLSQTLPSGTRVLYLSGDDVRHDAVTLLGARGYTVERQVAYQAIAEAMLPSVLRMEIENGLITGIAFYSVRSAEITCRLLTQEGLSEHAPRLTAYCMSLAVAQAAAALPFARLLTCHRPSQQSMLELMAARSE
jgi:uroporphyrinogen-III synthase